MHIRDMDQLMDILTKVYALWPAPAITVAAQNGADPFCILVATLISLRTRDAVTEQACQRLFPKAASPGQMIALGSRNIAALIHPASFSPTKGKRLVAISHILLEKYNAKVPDTMEALLALPGVGRKTANLVLVEAFGKPGLCVDTHVHRISNHLGLASTGNPDQTERVLRKEMPEKYWKAYSEILAVFGQKICRPRSPRCHECPISPFCDDYPLALNRK